MKKCKGTLSVHVRKNKFLEFCEKSCEILTHLLIFLFLLCFVLLLCFCVFQCIRLIFTPSNGLCL